VPARKKTASAAEVRDLSGGSKVKVAIANAGLKARSTRDTPRLEPLEM